ncbi:CopG family ribbon-helix-helix protein [Neorhizobium tomejilense]|jgi:predicted transcriptional regulator|uniref:CopG family ribbon-helix-helix protein n=1 Tax=Neorhizobium tomejilense TaxID=2093828 RepID=UPI003F4F4E0D
MDLKMTEATFTFRVEEELKAAFTEAAKADDQTSAQLLRKFMRDYIKQQQEAADYDVWFRQKVQKAIDSANAGDLLSEEDVETEFAALREEARKSSAQ